MFKLIALFGITLSSPLFGKIGGDVRHNPHPPKVVETQFILDLAEIDLSLLGRIDAFTCFSKSQQCVCKGKKDCDNLNRSPVCHDFDLYACTKSKKDSPIVCICRWKISRS